ncbi:hypothetical protein TRIP_B350089 [uncultured Desulfatiglans sp.]|nr:hypothetical protein TRIP_B350089 [uncultured Desulfatiglans sp.]
MGFDKSVTIEDIYRRMRGFVAELHELVDGRNVIHLGPPSVDESGESLVPESIIVSDDELAVLECLAKMPYQVLTTIKKNFKKMDHDQVLQGLLEKGLVLREKVAVKGNAGNFFPLTEKAQDFLKVSEKKRVSPAFYVHSLWRFWVYRSLLKNGLEGICEYTAEGINGRIDVYCKSTKTAYEVTRSFKNLCGNALKCFNFFKASELVIVCGTVSDCEKAKDVLKGCLPQEQLGKTKVKRITEFL